MEQKASFKKDRIVLGYYPLRGKMQICRLLCEYLHLSYKDLLFTPATWETFKSSQQLDWNYQELPFLLDGDLVITETYPIVLYILHKANRKDLLGSDINQQTKIDMWIWDCELICQNMYLALIFAKTKESQTMEFMKNWKSFFKPKMDIIEQECLHDSYVGYLTIIDIYLYDFIYNLKSSKIDTLIDFERNYPRLNRIYQRVSEIEEIKAYEKSAKAIRSTCPAEFCEQWKGKCVKETGIKNSG